MMRFDFNKAARSLFGDASFVLTGRDVFAQRDKNKLLELARKKDQDLIDLRREGLDLSREELEHKKSSRGRDQDLRERALDLDSKRLDLTANAPKKTNTLETAKVFMERQKQLENSLNADPRKAIFDQLSADLSSPQSTDFRPSFVGGKTADEKKKQAELKLQEFLSTNPDFARKKAQIERLNQEINNLTGATSPQSATKISTLAATPPLDQNGIPSPTKTEAQQKQNLNQLQTLDQMQFKSPELKDLALKQIEILKGRGADTPENIDGFLKQMMDKGLVQAINQKQPETEQPEQPESIKQVLAIESDSSMSKGKKKRQLKKLMMDEATRREIERASLDMSPEINALIGRVKRVMGLGKSETTEKLNLEFRKRKLNRTLSDASRNKSIERLLRSQLADPKSRDEILSQIDLLDGELQDLINQFLKQNPTTKALP